MNSVMRLLKLLSPYLPLMFGASFIGALTVVCNMGLMGTSILLLSKAAFMPPVLDLMVLIVAVRFFGLSRAILRYVERVVTHDITFKSIAKLRLWFYKSILPLIPCGIKNYSSTTTGNRITDGIDQVQGFYVKVINGSLVALVVMLFTIILVSFFSSLAAVILMISFVISGLVLPIISYNRLRLVNQQLFEYREVEKRLIKDYLGGMVDLSYYNKVKSSRDEINRVNSKVIMLQDKKERIGSLSNNIITFISYLTVILVMMATINRIDPLWFGAIGIMVLASFEALYVMPTVINELDNTRVAADSIFQLCDGDNKGLQTAGNSFYSDNIAIKFDDVHFSYGNHRVLNGIDLDIKYGEKICLLGDSGAGKSTIADLLVGFGLCDSGKIFINEVDINLIDEYELRNMIGLLEQCPYIFTGTIRDNILMANPRCNDDDMIYAAKISGIHGFIMGLPDGYNSNIGESGYKLSGGQKERLALTRLIVKNPPVVILDEMFQGLDSITAKKLYGQIMNWAQQKTIIFITHDLFLVDQADRVYRLEEGKLKTLI